MRATTLLQVVSDEASTYNGAINDYLSPQYLRYLATHVSGKRTNFDLPRYITSEFGNNSSEGSLDIYAGYLMTDAPLTSWLRFIGGVRYETTLYNVSGLSRDSTKPASSTIDAADVLPAVKNAAWNLRCDLRAKYRAPSGR